MPLAVAPGEKCSTPHPGFDLSGHSTLSTLSVFTSWRPTKPLDLATLEFANTSCRGMGRQKR